MEWSEEHRNILRVKKGFYFDFEGDYPDIKLSEFEIPPGPLTKEEVKKWEDKTQSEWIIAYLEQRENFLTKLQFARRLEQIPKFEGSYSYSLLQQNIDLHDVDMEKSETQILLRAYLQKIEEKNQGVSFAHRQEGPQNDTHIVFIAFDYTFFLKKLYGDIRKTSSMTNDLNKYFFVQYAKGLTSDPQSIILILYNTPPHYDQEAVSKIQKQVRLKRCLSTVLFSKDFDEGESSMSFTIYTSCISWALDRPYVYQEKEEEEEEEEEEEP